MIFNKKIKMFVCALLPTLVTPCLFSCSSEKKIDDFNISINSGDTVQFSNNVLFPTRPIATFPFQIENPQTDDIVSVYIESQEMDGESGVFLSLCHESRDIVVHKNQKNINIQFIPTALVDVTKVAEIRFSISCSLIRDDNIIFKKRFDNLYFENGTPTTPDMFSYDTKPDGSKILVGWKQEEWVFEQISKCNILLIPNDVAEIANEAFCERWIEEGDPKTTIPDNIDVVCLNSYLNHLDNVSKLTKIGSYAFYGCKAKFHDLLLPAEFSYIGEYAFYDCSNLSGTILLSSKITKLNRFAFFNCSKISSIIFNSLCSLDEGSVGGCDNLKIINVASFNNNIPNVTEKNDNVYWVGQNNFNNVPPSDIHYPRYVYLNNLVLLDAWKNFFEDRNQNFDNWTFAVADKKI